MTLGLIELLVIHGNTWNHPTIFLSIIELLEIKILVHLTLGSKGSHAENAMKRLCSWSM